MTNRRDRLRTDEPECSKLVKSQEFEQTQQRLCWNIASLRAQERQVKINERTICGLRNDTFVHFSSSVQCFRYGLHHLPSFA